jgi:low temperature requirement protein LtrA
MLVRMVDGPRVPRGLVGRLRAAEASSRVTTFELFFDLVYVFAFTQVSRLMADTHSAFGILQALVVLALMWWTWAAFGWLAN